jgi:hypothetical protein
MSVNGQKRTFATEVSMGDRLVFAAIGAVFGLAVGAMLWWLYGLNFSRNAGPSLATIRPFLPWAVGGSLAGGLGGFVLKDRAADLFAAVLKGVFDAEDGRDIPTWLQVIAVLSILAVLTWIFWKS